MKRYTRPFDITDHPDYERDRDHDSRECELCGERYEQHLMHDLNVWVCEDCVPAYIKNELEYEDKVEFNGFEIRMIPYGFHFKSIAHPLTESFTVPTLEEGLKKIP